MTEPYFFRTNPGTQINFEVEPRDRPCWRCRWHLRFPPWRKHWQCRKPVQFSIYVDE